MCVNTLVDIDMISVIDILVERMGALRKRDANKLLLKPNQWLNIWVCNLLSSIIIWAWRTDIALTIEIHQRIDVGTAVNYLSVT